jgi:penicillin-binding protein 2
VVGFFVFGVVALVVGRVLYLGFSDLDFYRARAESNLSETNRLPAPRGLIIDAYGKTLAQNKPVFRSFLNVRDFLKNDEEQLKVLEAVLNIFGIKNDDLWKLIEEDNEKGSSNAVLLGENLNQEQIVEINRLNLSSISVVSGFSRVYPYGEVFSSVIGYTGVVDSDDLVNYPKLSGRDLIGKTGVEKIYESILQGEYGSFKKIRDAKGAVLEEKEEQQPKIGKSLRLTIDSDFQNYFYERLRSGLIGLGRRTGIGLALNPETGEVLALINFPNYDNNVFSDSTKGEERGELFLDSRQPLFNRAIGGYYNPGSTIKPLVGVAALEEKVINPQKYIFSPGFIDIPNRYNPDKPTRFLDWRYQGDVNMPLALAFSSNVYFYVVGGGSPYSGSSITGLGISRLRDWWQKFNLGKATGIDLPGEADGFLPSPEDKKKKTGTEWFLGDTYNVSIGQGDLLVTPIQLLSYIGAIANGGSVYRPYVAKELNQPKVISDLIFAKDSIGVIQGGMLEAVKNEKGTAHLLNSLSFPIAGKTGSAQVKNKAQENAFFVGYIPDSVSKGVEWSTTNGSKIALLILIEDAKQGSLNAVPIAKDVLSWYYENRISTE